MLLVAAHSTHLGLPHSADGCVCVCACMCARWDNCLSLLFTVEDAGWRAERERERAIEPGDSIELALLCWFPP